MKFHIFTRTIGIQLLLAVFVLWPPVDRLSVRLFLFTGFLAWLVIRFFTARRQYLADLRIVENRMELQFISSQLVSRSLQLDVGTISGVQVSRARFPYQYKGSVRIHTPERWYTFLVLNDKVYKKAEQAVGAANLQLC